MSGYGSMRFPPGAFPATLEAASSAATTPAEAPCRRRFGPPHAMRRSISMSLATHSVIRSQPIYSKGDTTSERFTCACPTLAFGQGRQVQARSTGSQGRQDHHDLHSRPQPRRPGRAQPARRRGTRGRTSRGRWDETDAGTLCQLILRKDDSTSKKDDSSEEPTSRPTLAGDQERGYPTRNGSASHGPARPKARSPAIQAGS